VIAQRGLGNGWHASVLSAGAASLWLAMFFFNHTLF